MKLKGKWSQYYKTNVRDGLQAWIYLLRNHSHHVAQFSNDKVDTFQTWLSQASNLLFHNCFKSHVGREKTHSDT